MYLVWKPGGYEKGGVLPIPLFLCFLRNEKREERVNPILNWNLELRPELILNWKSPGTEVTPDP